MQIANLTKFEQHFALCFWFNQIKKKENMKITYGFYNFPSNYCTYLFVS